MGTRSVLMLALLVPGALLAAAAPASARSRHPTVAFTSPVCVNGLDVSFDGAVNWRSGPSGTVSVTWGDTTGGVSSFPDWHVYASPGPYTITLTASNADGAGAATRTIVVGPGVTTCRYTIRPQPLAEEGTLVPGQSVSTTVTVTNTAGGAGAGEAPVWLSLAAAPGGGTATACCSAVGQTTQPLGPTPTAFIAGLGTTKGTVSVTYTAPATLPASGSDVIAAAGDPSGAAPGTATTSYEFSPTPVPLAPPSTIADDCSVDVSKPLGQWLRNLPPDATVVPPDGACYQVDEGLSLSSPVGLTIDGGTYENMSVTPNASTGHGTPRGDPVFNVVGGSDLTFENVAIEGQDPTGTYLAAMAFAGGIELQGTVGAVIDDDTMTGVFGDGITLAPLRNDPDHEGPVILNPCENITIDDVTIDGAGRMGITFSSVGGSKTSSVGATVTDVSVSNVGLDTFDVEADQSNEGSENVTIDGCTADSPVNPLNLARAFFANGGPGSPNGTGNITVENCTMAVPQGNSAVYVAGPVKAITPRGPLVFLDDTFECGTGTSTAPGTCLSVADGAVTVQDSSLLFPLASPDESAYQAAQYSTLSLDDDTASGYASCGTSDSTSTVDVSGGSWTPPCSSSSTAGRAGVRAVPHDRP